MRMCGAQETKMVACREDTIKDINLALMLNNHDFILSEYKLYFYI
jgi:hypothetical protein